MKKRIQAVCLALLCVSTSPIWIPCVVVWIGVHSHDGYDITEEDLRLK